MDAPLAACELGCAERHGGQAACDRGSVAHWKGDVSTPPIVSFSPAELLGRATAFGLLAVAGIAAIVIAGAWWASCIAALGLLCAMAGLVVSVLALLDENQPASWRDSRPVALGLATLSVAAIVVALVAV
jgi:hypothetical protein